jgi:vitamin B12 transporter
VGIEIDRRLSEAIDLRALVTLHDLDSGTDDAPDGPEDNVGFFGFQSLDAMRRVTADLRGNVHLPGGAALTAGAEVERERVRSFSESLSEFGSSVGRSNNSRANAAGYAHAVGSVGRISLNGGIRVEENEQFGRFASFQLGSSIRLRPDTRIRFAVGRGVKEPTFFEAYATGFAVGNPDLDPERSTSWEVGVEREIPGGGRAEATWFDQSFRDLIQYTSSPPEPAGPNFFNVAAADSRGLEMEIRAPVGPVALSAGWTWLDTKVTDSGFDEGPSAMFVDGEPLIRRPRNTVTLGLGAATGSRVRWSADLRWVGKRSDRDFSVFPAERVTLDSYTVIDAGMDATLIRPDGGRPGLDLLFRAENLGNARYEEIVGFPAPGRGLYVGGRIGWGGDG